MFAASPSPTMEAAFGRLHKDGRAAFGGAPTFVDSIVGDGEAANMKGTCGAPQGPHVATLGVNGVPLGCQDKKH